MLSFPLSDFVFTCTVLLPNRTFLITLKMSHSDSTETVKAKAKISQWNTRPASWCRQTKILFEKILCLRPRAAIAASFMSQSKHIQSTKKNLLTNLRQSGVGILRFYFFSAQAPIMHYLYSGNKGQWWWRSCIRVGISKRSLYEGGTPACKPGMLIWWWCWKHLRLTVEKNVFSNLRVSSWLKSAQVSVRFSAFIEFRSNSQRWLDWLKFSLGSRLVSKIQMSLLDLLLKLREVCMIREIGLELMWYCV